MQKGLHGHARRIIVALAAVTRQCRELGEDKLTAIFKDAILQFDEIKREKGRNAACAWADKLEKAIVQDVTK